jgi:ABC-2 type transport system permease protein
MIEHLKYHEGKFIAAFEDKASENNERMETGIVIDGNKILFTQIAGFLASLVLAIALNFMIFYCISAISFWIVEIGFLFEGIRITTVLLSGGIFPLEVFGETFQQVMSLLPFKYTVSFPINILTGKIPPGEIGLGLVVQCVWIGLCMLLAGYLWRLGSKRYVAVGG